MPFMRDELKLVGIIEKIDGKLQLRALNKRDKKKFYDLSEQNQKDANVGDVVTAERVNKGGTQKAEISKILGQKSTPGILTLISLYEQGLSDKFSDASLKQAKGLTVPSLEGREDLRNIPLVTVDGPTSRDFDDAIFAEDTPDGGKHLIVAIADVSWYVRPGDAIDEEAYKRGNSTYFPDRAVAMLPEELSNGLCSLKPNEDRACMAYHLWIDKDGNLVDKKINRALMRSAARLTYEQLQSAKDGKPDNVTGPLMDKVVNPLYEAYDLLKKASDARGPLVLDAPEYITEVDANGEAVKVVKEDDSTSHDVIAQFMILANVAGDTALAEAKAEAIHRLHNAPSEDKIKNLITYLDTFGLALPSGEPVTDNRALNEIIEEARQKPNAEEILTDVISAIARAQSKAVYDAQNNGHFGLALERYGHHTSPIRRYADLINHRSLVSAFNMGAGALNAEQKNSIQEIADHVSQTEILSSRAERSASDRFAISALSRHVGEEFEGRITGAGNAGLFVRVKGVSTDGLIPMRSLQPNDFYNYDKETRSLKGQRTGQVHSVGDKIKVRLKSADSLSTRIVLEAVNDNQAGAGRPQRNSRPQRKNRNRGPNPR